MAFSNSSNHPYKIYVSTLPIKFYKDDQSLEYPLITFKCCIKVNFVSDKSDKSVQSCIPYHDSWHEFEHHLINDQLTRDFISNMFSNTSIIPFPLGNLHWKKRISDKESVPLMSTDNVVTLMLDVCHGMDRESSRKKLFLIVFIEKQVIVPHDEYLAMLKAKKTQEILHQVRDTVNRLLAQGLSIQRSDWENMVNVVRQAGLVVNSIRDALNLVRERASRESTEQAMKVRFVPAAETSIQALEKVTFCNGSKYSEEKCSMCMEEMLTGSQLTRMPCSHVFHGDCIVQWLKTSHMCPVCRFKLPTA